MPEKVPFPGATRKQVIWGRENLAVGPVRLSEEEWHGGHLGLRKVLELMLQEPLSPAGRRLTLHSLQQHLANPGFAPSVSPWGREDRTQAYESDPDMESGFLVLCWTSPHLPR